jgi:peptidylprolyl isomerase
VPAKNGDTVQVHYTGKLNNGSVFDSSNGRDPLQFLIGGGQIIPGFEDAVMGMSPGDNKTITISAEKAYGPYRQELLLAVDRQQMPSDAPIELGQPLQVQQSNGQSIPVRVKNISESQVILDANHPLAGQDLTFDIELIAIS